jgi:hypothetical protein
MSHGGRGLTRTGREVGNLPPTSRRVAATANFESPQADGLHIPRRCRSVTTDCRSAWRDPLPHLVDLDVTTPFGTGRACSSPAFSRPRRKGETRTASSNPGAGRHSPFGPCRHMFERGYMTILRTHNGRSVFLPPGRSERASEFTGASYCVAKLLRGTSSEPLARLFYFRTVTTK